MFAAHHIRDTGIDGLSDGNAENKGYAGPKRLKVCSTKLVGNDLRDIVVNWPPMVHGFWGDLQATPETKRLRPTTQLSLS
jgi:hypothetical protein